MAANGVKFLIVGGYAVTKYAEPRYTKDLDLWVLADIDNAQKVHSALRAFGAPLTNISPNDFAHEGYFYQMGVPPIRVSNHWKENCRMPILKRVAKMEDRERRSLAKYLKGKK